MSVWMSEILRVSTLLAINSTSVLLLARDDVYAGGVRLIESEAVSELGAELEILVGLLTPWL